MPSDPPTRSHRYAQLTWPEVAERAAEDPVCVIPVATLEDHGYHLPIDRVQLGQMAGVEIEVAGSFRHSVGQFEESLGVGKAVESTITLLEERVVGHGDAGPSGVDHSLAVHRLVVVHDGAEAQHDDVVNAVVVGIGAGS